MRNLLALIILVISFSALSADPGSVRPPHKDSKISISEIDGICAAWNVQERDVIEDDLDSAGLDIAVEYFQIECDTNSFPLLDYPLFLRVVYDLSYKVPVKWLMRKFKKSPRADKNELLTCALNHTSYQNETIIEGLERQLRVLDGYIADAQNEQDRLDAEWGKKEAKNIIAYMKKHTDKYPVAKPLEFCPLHPRSSAKIKP